MSYQVIARKWRPQTFDEVVFQEHVSKTLKNSIRNGRVSHAYLFSGPRGVGKTTIARILAKSLNCVDGPTETPCGKCENCLEIKAGSAFDVIEIDGASNRGIEDIRELRENVNFAPVKGRYKVYIIDEVHMLTREAFNALLKTLEEPPSKVIFIFATTEIHQIPETILSRCQKFFFKKIPVEPVVDHMKRIVDREGYRISDGALYSIARASGGSMRDAQSLLEQVISFSDFREAGDDSIDIEIKEEDALAVLGIVPVESYVRLLSLVSAADPAGAMTEIDRVVTLGVDIPRYAGGLSDLLRSLRFIKNSISVKELLNLSDEEHAVLAGVADLYHDEELSILYRLSLELQAELRFSQSERVNLEMSVLDMISVKKAPSLAEILRRLEGGSVDKRPPHQVSSAPGAAPRVPAQKTEPGQQVHESGTDAERVIAAWNDFVRDGSKTENSLHIIIKPAQAGYSNGTLQLSYPEGDEFLYYRRSLDRTRLDFIAAEISKRSGLTVNASLQDKSAPSPAQPGAAPAAAKTENRPAPPPDEEIPPPDAEMMKNPEEVDYETTDPAVDKIVKTFHGQIIEKKGG
jgi:DNA polymerase-3 subunit gamma/tau